MDSFGADEEKVKYLGIEDKVLFPGARNDMNKWYQAMDVFCMPSRFEDWESY